MRVVRLALVMSLAAAPACSNQDAIAPSEHPLLTSAQEIAADDIYTQELRGGMSVEAGDTVFTIPADQFQVLARLRTDASPHLYATSCEVLALIEPPDGWESTCLERTVNGQRLTGGFADRLVSE